MVPDVDKELIRRSPKRAVSSKLPSRFWGLGLYFALLPNPKAQNSPKALYSMVFGPKGQ